MRYLLLTLISLCIASPAFAERSICRMEGPHNCSESSETELVDITKSTIHNMELTRVHAFKTQNDKILEAAAREHVELNNIPQGDRYLFLSR